MRAFAASANQPCIDIESRRSGDPETGFHSAPPHDRKEPSLLICCVAADVRYAEVSQKFGKTYCDFAKGFSNIFQQIGP